MLFKTMVSDETYIIPEGFNAGSITVNTGDVTIKPLLRSFANQVTGSKTVTSNFTFPDGVDLGGTLLITNGSGTATVELYRVGGKPENDEGRKK